MTYCVDKPVILFLLFALLFFTRDTRETHVGAPDGERVSLGCEKLGNDCERHQIVCLSLTHCFECCVSFSPLSFSQIISGLSVSTFFLGGMVSEGHTNIFDISLWEGLSR